MYHLYSTFIKKLSGSLTFLPESALVEAHYRGLKLEGNIRPLRGLIAETSTYYRCERCEYVTDVNSPAETSYQECYLFHYEYRHSPRQWKCSCRPTSSAWRCEATCLSRSSSTSLPCTAPEPFETSPSCVALAVSAALPVETLAYPRLKGDSLLYGELFFSFSHGISFCQYLQPAHV